MIPEEETELRVLVAIPAYNEESSIQGIIRGIQDSLFDFDLLVVNDGSQDATGQILDRLGVTTATHLCNLGYGRAIQTAIKYAIRYNYDVLITLDADGQHVPHEVLRLYNANKDLGWDMLIGSRYVKIHDYSQVPFGRRIGMRLFSLLVRMVTGHHIYDTTSGMKVMRRSVFEALTRWRFIDFHAESIVFLLRLGYMVMEFPITVVDRKQGRSMYNALSHITYPLKTSLIILLSVVQAELTRRRNKL